MKPDVDEFVNEVFAAFDPDAAAERFHKHITRWTEDMVARPEVYEKAVQDGLSTLSEVQGAALVAIWGGMRQRMQCTTDEECNAIDQWLDPLIESAPSTDHDPCWLGVLQSSYFTPAIDAELESLSKVSGFDEAVERHGFV